ncbi:MAG: pyridoxamine kinase [Clostridia bacterium]|mgnify:FL=1|nr:pyridoxamine kinase [Clostridia bacterium]
MSREPKFLTPDAKAAQRPMPTVLAVHDLSCFGRCALTVILPVLSAMGLQAVPVPTALLSTHTGGFENYYFEDLTEAMEKISAHLWEVGFRADAVYTGFLGSEQQIQTVSGMIDRFGVGTPGETKALVLVDPVMGDDGCLYSTYTPGMMQGMSCLCEKADVITPNVTEACFLTGTAFCDTSEWSEKETEAYAARLCEKLCRFGTEKIVVTGIHFGHNRIGTYGYDAAQHGGQSFLYGTEYVSHAYPGTGDFFASVLLGELMRGKPFERAVVRASDLTGKVIGYSAGFDTPTRNGVAFEPFLAELSDE